MDVLVRYCAVCGYRGRALALAERIRERLGVAAALEHGHLGQFDVLADGEVVATRAGGLINHLTRGGFPEEADVLAALERRQRTRR